jgi:hypothetical protein
LFTGGPFRHLPDDVTAQSRSLRIKACR